MRRPYHAFANSSSTPVLSSHSISCVDHVKCQHVTLSTVPNSTIPDCSRFLAYTKLRTISSITPTYFNSSRGAFTITSCAAYSSVHYIHPDIHSTRPLSQGHCIQTQSKAKAQKARVHMPRNRRKRCRYIFCQHCGGAKEVPPWTGDGEPNAKCIGVCSSDLNCIE